MAKNLIDFENIEVKGVKKVIIENGLKINNQNLTETAFKIANACSDNLSAAEFKKLTGLSK